MDVKSDGTSQDHAPLLRKPCSYVTVIICFQPMDCDPLGGLAKSNKMFNKQLNFSEKVFTIYFK